MSRFTLYGAVGEAPAYIIVERVTTVDGTRLRVVDPKYTYTELQSAQEYLKGLEAGQTATDIVSPFVPTQVRDLELQLSHANRVVERLQDERERWETRALYAESRLTRMKTLFISAAEELQED